MLIFKIETILAFTLLIALFTGCGKTTGYAIPSNYDFGLVAKDSFDRSNSTTSLGSTDNGLDYGGSHYAWSTGGISTMGILNGAMYAINGGSATIPGAFFDVGKANCTVKVKLKKIAGSNAIVGLRLRRASDANEILFVHDMSGSVGTNIYTLAIMPSITALIIFSATPADSDILSIILSGTSISGSIIRSGATLETKTATTSAFQTQTTFGVMDTDTSGTTGLLDDFEIRDCS